MTPEQAQARKVRRELQDLSNSILLFIDAVDSAFMKDKTVPREAGARLARLVTALDMRNDQVRYGALGVDFRRDNKARVVAQVKQGSGR